jgi:hypothetical protein
MSALTDVLEKRGHPNPLLAALISGKRRSDGASVQKAVTSAHRLTTGPTDTPASTAFDSVITPGWKLTRHIAAPKTYFGASGNDWGQLVLDNAHAQLSDWDEIDFNGHEVDLRMGARRKINGDPWEWSDYETILTPKVRGIGQDPQGRKIVKLSATADDRPLIEEVYRGFQGALQLGPGLTAAASHHSSLEFAGGPLTIIITAKLASSPIPSTNFARKFITGGAGSSAFNLTWSGDYDLRFISQTDSIYSDGGIVYGSDCHYIATIGGDGVTVKLYAGRFAADLALVGSGTLSAAIPSSAGDFQIRSGPPATAADWWQIALVAAEMTLAELRDVLDRPIKTTLADLAHLWKFNETSGLTAAATVGGQDLTVDSGGTWETTYEGADPDDFEGSPAGQVKPALWGQGRGVEVVCVDPQRQIYAYDHAAADGPLDAAYANGAVLATPAQYTSDLTTSTVTFPLGSDVPEGVLTVDTTGRTAGKISELYATLAGETPDAAHHAWDPDVMMISRRDKSPDLEASLLALARSGCGWTARQRDGTRMLGTWTAPTESDPALRIYGGGPRGQIISVEGTRAATPAYKLVCRYAPAGIALDRGVIPGSVDPDDRDYLASDWLTAEREDPTVLDAYPAAGERVVETYLTTAANAELWLDRAAVLFMQTHRWPVVTVAGLEPFGLELFDEIYVEHSNPEYELTDGAYFRVVGVRDAPGTGATRLWLWN